MSWRERVAWLGAVAVLAIATLFYRGEALKQQNARFDAAVGLIAAQQDVIKMQREAVQAASRSVEIAAQGRNDCAQSLEVVTQRQNWLNSGLGLGQAMKERR